MNGNGTQSMTSGNGSPSIPPQANADVAVDGTHPSASGCRKVANLLLTFFATDATTAWFRRQ